MYKTAMISTYHISDGKTTSEDEDESNVTEEQRGVQRHISVMYPLTTCETK